MRHERRVIFMLQNYTSQGYRSVKYLPICDMIKRPSQDFATTLHAEGHKREFILSTIQDAFHHYGLTS